MALADGVVMLIIPPDELSPQTLAALVDDFVTRDGAVQGHTDHSLEQKRQSVLAQLRAGTVAIIFDEEEGAVTLVSRPG